MLNDARSAKVDFVVFCTKGTKMVTTRHTHFLGSKYTKNVFVAGLCPRPTGEAHSTAQTFKQDLEATSQWRVEAKGKKEERKGSLRKRGRGIGLGWYALTQMRLPEA